VYAAYFRGEGETQWKLLRGDTHENSVTFDADALADGKYFFRVVASDREANPPPTAREAQLVSAPVMIDNTPPVVTIGVVRHSAAPRTLSSKPPTPPPPCGAASTLWTPQAGCPWPPPMA